MIGFMSGQIDLMRFFPNKLVVHPGDTVEWTLSIDNGAPHTVTFLNDNPDISFVVPVPQLFRPGSIPGQNSDVLWPGYDTKLLLQLTAPQGDLYDDKSLSYPRIHPASALCAAFITAHSRLYAVTIHDTNVGLWRPRNHA
jgi:hypothetical protein